MHDEGRPVEENQEYADHAVIETTLRYIADATPPPARHPGSSVTLAFDRPSVHANTILTCSTSA
ncbi:hypothetical protein ACRWOO_31020 [Streptomyces sp. NEAU-PBA10]|uniref:hypothetical protein n=1 Tax=unclassified Streptomyces TaxID=2593676 RepID=UPI001D03AFF4|nr:MULTISPECIES: hypothetical protein [unclassified Streptomyces]UDF08788.1 hypothetical protein LH646_15190 [Streptomyces sp. WA1-19]UYX97642.1 hypothetical protein OIM89_29795 [Streptomyces sp. BI87]